MTEIGDDVDDETKEQLKQAAIDNERNRTVYGDKLPEDHREDDDE